ncbi:MAG: type II toxin-antitoxin system VapC family toxin [Candidatus Helarchaeota archaeon]
MATDPEIIILDASIIVKWFNKELYSDKAVSFKNKHLNNEVIIYVPSLIYFEIANALRYNPEFGENDLVLVIQALKDLQLKVIPINDWLFNAISLAYKFGITIYDASYIALGQYFNAKIITADEKLKEKVNLPLLITLKEID